ncbi:alpha/beta hydrolase [Marinomonas epiphytica]
MAIKRLEVSNPDYTPLHLTTMTVHSSYTQRRHDVSVYQQATSGKDLPIIILLHGVYGSHWVWLQLGGVDKVYEELKSSHQIEDFILVMPSDGGFQDGSAYLPTLNNGDYEGWIMHDLLDAVKGNLTSASDLSRLYITGLSMGGYGALRLGAKYASRFSGISAHSAITQLPQIQQFTDTDLEAYQCSTPHESDLLHWFKVNSLHLPPLRFDCGQEDELYEGNANLHKNLQELGVDHNFQTFPGGHSWDYWHKYIAHTLLYFTQIEHSIKHH